MTEQARTAPDIVDTQVHFNRIGSPELGLAAMDAAGVTAVMYDESIPGRSASGNVLPGHELPHGGFRPLCPQAEALARRYPNRFGVLRRVDYRDPDLGFIARLMADGSYGKAFRVISYDPDLKTDDFEAFGRGDYNNVFAAADTHGIPVVVLVPGRTELLVRYIQRFPDLRIIIDHCGVALQRSGGFAGLDKVLTLARYKNVSLKWGHAPFLLSRMPYPFLDLIPALKRAVSAFGPERVMWASDFTVTAKLFSWAETLFYIRDSTEFSDIEKQWILGRAARSIYGWAAPSAAKAE